MFLKRKRPETEVFGRKKSGCEGKVLKISDFVLPFFQNIPFHSNHFIAHHKLKIYKVYE